MTNGQGPDLEGLRSFADRDDREESPIFVGRERETEHVMRRAELVGEAHAEGRSTQGATTVITGCPGSGKSAFLGHFARTFARLEPSNNVLIPVQCNHQDLTARNSKELQAQLAELALEKTEGMHETLRAIAQDLGQKLKLESTFGHLEKKIRHDKQRGTVVCLLVDEIQNVTEASALATQLLHTGAFSPPVLPVYAGLDDSVDRLQTVCRISRLSAKGRMTMGKLRENAAREAASMLFKKYNVRGEPAAQSAWAKAIDEEALDFAQHLHVSLQAACTVLVEREGLARVADAAEVKLRARAARESFYASKTTGMVEDHAKAVLDVVDGATRAKTRLTRLDIAALAKKSMQRHSPLSTEYGDEAALALVEQLRHRGLLHLSPEGRAEVPIPSLRTWLAEAYAREHGWQPTRGGEKYDPDRRRDR